MHDKKRQAGGTLLGLIVGLIIGLSIAVVVAIMIKNTPLPFTNKVSRPEKAAEASAPVADPNKALYGKREARQAAKPAEEEKPAEAAAGNAPAPATAAAPSADPIRDIANAKPAAKPAENRAPVVEKSTPPENKLAKLEPAPAADEKFTYYLQAGAFLEQADAENTKARLALMGVGASIAERKSDNGTLYRVRIGPFAQFEAMNRVRGKLSDNGVDVAVVRVPK